MLSKRILAGLLLAATTLMGGISVAAPPDLLYPVIPRFGGIMAVPGAAERPDPKLRYRVLFNVTKAASAPDQLNPSLEKVARFVNLLGADKVRPSPGDIVVIIHGPATPLILQNAPYAARMKVTENPNVMLIAALRNAGVSVHVCSQAMTANKITPDQVTSGVVIDASGRPRAESEFGLSERFPSAPAGREVITNCYAELRSTKHPPMERCRNCAAPTLERTSA